MTKKTEQDRLIILADTLVDELFEMSDNEILDDFEAEGGDPDANSQKMKSILESAQNRGRKSRLLAAKAGVQKSKQDATISNIVDLGKIRKALNSAFSQKNVTLAARNEKASDLTDEEAIEKYQDMIELGLIKPTDQDGD